MPKKKSKKEIKQLIALEWPSALAFGTLLPDYMLYENPEFNRENTDMGSIEYFGPFEAAFDYNNDYKKKDAPDADFVAPYDRLYPPKYVYNPYGISPTIMYDPNSNTVDDIKLDLLHHYRKVDPVYKSLVDDYTEAIMDNLGDDLIWNSSFPLEYKRYYNGDTKAMQEHMSDYNRGASTIPFNSPFIEQGIDGSLRNLLANDETIENSNYLPREDAEKQWLSTPEARKAFDNIKLYLTTYRLPEVTVTGHKHEDGGALNWEELPMKDRHYYILQGVALGLRDIDSIKESYNLYALGGNIYATKGALKKGSNTPKGGKQRFIELLDKKLADSRYAYFNTPLWRNYFINLVNKESGYNPNAVNKDTGASGYFLIMPQYKWYKNDEELFDLIFLMTKSNLDLIRKSLTKQDLRNLEAMGYDIYGIAGGAHLGGANGLLNFIKRGINAQDANHSSVKGYISSFSQSPKRNMSDTNQLSLLDFSTDTTGYTDLIVTVPDDEVPQQKPIIIEEVPEEPQLPLLTIPVVPTIADTAPVQNTGNSFLLPTLFLSLINLGLVEDPLTYSPKVNTVDIPITATDILKKQKLKLQQKYLDDVDDRYIKNIINSTYLNNSFADGGTAESFLSKLYPSAVAKRLYEDMIINGGTLPEVVVTGDKMRAINNRLNNLYSSYGVNPTDNTWAEPINILLQNEKVQNPQLLREAVEGAKKYNAWRENHPYMATAGDIASTIPVATAAYPVVSPAGSGIATALTNPYVQAGINSYFAAEGVDDIINGRANWSTPINFLPFYGGATKTLANAVGKAYNSGKKAYDTTRLAIGLNKDIKNFVPRYSLKGGNVRTRVGDVEIDNPQLYYRQVDSQAGGDFLNTGIVRAGDNAFYANPMFNKGSLFYPKYVDDFRKYKFELGNETHKTRSGKVFLIRKPKDNTPKVDLLVSNGEMQPAGKSSAPTSFMTPIIDENGNKLGVVTTDETKRIPLNEGSANKSNTSLYRWEPGYGYRVVKTNNPTTYNIGKDLVNEDGTLKHSVQDLVTDLRKKYPYLLNPEDLTNKGINGKTDLIEHIEDVVKSAQEYPIPIGTNRKDFVTAALYHDLGKLSGSYEHGTNSNVLVDFMGWNTNPNIQTAVARHMEPQEYFADAPSLTKGLHAADVGRGMNYDDLISKYNYLEYLNGRYNRSLGGQLRRRSLKSIKHKEL